MFAQYALFPPSFSMNDMEPHGFTAYIPITEGTSLADAQWPARPRREIISRKVFKYLSITEPP